VTMFFVFTRSNYNYIALDNDFVTMCIYVGSTINLNSLVYNPPRNGPTVWEIGIPDRSAGEFFVPKPYANLVNRLFTNNIPDQLVSKP
jgi:hypothetical protein